MTLNTICRITIKDETFSTRIVCMDIQYISNTTLLVESCIMVVGFDRAPNVDMNPIRCNDGVILECVKMLPAIVNQALVPYRACHFSKCPINKTKAVRKRTTLLMDSSRIISKFVGGEATGVPA